MPEDHSPHRRARVLCEVMTHAEAIEYAFQHLASAPNPNETKYWRTVHHLVTKVQDLDSKKGSE